MTFAQRIRQQADRLGTAEAARVCDVSPRTIQHWIQGKGKPNASTRAGALLLLEKAYLTGDAVSPPDVRPGSIP